MRRWALLMVVPLLILATLLGVGVVHAQRTIDPVPGTPPQCSNVGPYDHNLDGVVDFRDFDLWVKTVHEGAESCQMNGPAAGCPDWVDVNRDGVVTVADLDAMHDFMLTCLRPPKNTVPIPAL